MIDSRNSEKENSPIHPAIILRRMRTRIQFFLHRGRNEVQMHHYLTARKMKMKPHLGMNKYGVTSIKTEMKTFVTKFFLFFIVSLAKTRPIGIYYGSVPFIH